ncbi:HD domain-containing protein [Pseudomonas sp. NPDC089569]|uniref:HD domain-containing protein n=1 Tax=Pseudomonas sp. NPDC089569 TaxID=3390722 RepID=UPI003CFEFFE6
MASSSTIKLSSGLIALFTMLCVLVGVYAFYLEEVGAALDYQADALAPSWFMIKPQFVIDEISSGGLVGTLTAIAVNIVYAVFYAGFVYSLVTLLLARFFKPRNKKFPSANQAELSPATTGLYPCSIEGSTMMVMIPEARNPKTGEVIPGVQDEDPFTQVFMRCDRKPIVTARAPATPIENLQIALYELLEAHPNTPASVGHHHADATLKDHSIDLSKVVVSYMKERSWEEPLARVAGLAHDLDKLLAYQEKKPGVWVKRKDATHHNTYSAYLVAQQPEFSLLPPEDRFTLTMALRYYHHPKFLPINAGERVERLISAIRHADGAVIQTEKINGIVNAQGAENTTSILESAMEQFFVRADINGYQGTHNAAGWTKDALEFVIIPMSRIIESIGEFVPNELSRQLQLNVDSRNFSHPAIPVILDLLTKMDLLQTTNKQAESPTGRWDVKVGMKLFKACVLLDKDRISEMVPAIVPKWGMTAYDIKVVRPTLDKMQSDPAADGE